MKDEVILVDEQDNQIGVMDKVEAHRGEGKRHRAVSVFLFNDGGKLLIQQRSREKIVGALQWANTCCGNVRPTESYEECALRRLEEELGITGVSIRSVHKFEYHVRCNEAFSEFEIDTVFFGQFDGNVVLNHAEVAQVEWVDSATILAQMKQANPQYEFAPWFRILVEQEHVLQDFLIHVTGN